MNRIVVLFYELLAELFLLSILMGTLVIPFPEIIYAIRELVFLAFSIGVILTFYGYYLTRAFVGVVWRSEKRWTYPAIAATLFFAHVAPFLIPPNLASSQTRQAEELLFLAGGPFIVFACAYVGNWLLRKWTKPPRTENGPQSHPSGPVAPGTAPEN